MKVQKGKESDVIYLADKEYPTEHKYFSRMTELLDRVNVMNLSFFRILV